MFLLDREAAHLFKRCLSRADLASRRTGAHNADKDFWVSNSKAGKEGEVMELVRTLAQDVRITCKYPSAQIKPIRSSQEERNGTVHSQFTFAGRWPGRQHNV